MNEAAIIYTSTWIDMQKLQLIILAYKKIVTLTAEK